MADHPIDFTSERIRRLEEGFAILKSDADRLTRRIGNQEDKLHNIERSVEDVFDRMATIERRLGLIANPEQ